MRCLMWFREDLRISDNTALLHAIKRATQGLIAIYIISLDDWKRHDIAACRVDFILRQLKILSMDLAQYNIPLLFFQVSNVQEVIATLADVIKNYSIDGVFFNYQYEIDEARRDLKIETCLKKEQIKIFAYHDQVIIPPGELLTQNNNFYTVFTPFKKVWLKNVNAAAIKPLPLITTSLPDLNIASTPIPTSISGYQNSINPEEWPVSENYAQNKLTHFIAQKINVYDQERDFPARDGTSCLSPYLASGILSPRQCLYAAFMANNQQLFEGNSGIITWINELIWREFYKHILCAYPRVSMHRAFKMKTENIPWENNHSLFLAWCEGKTGYPIIDAAMRQLNTIGWMHNRLRMITAMFLVKHLLIDWRWGEKYFMQHLIDGDLAANNGGWQWAASTGTDAVPYFRIMNPIKQSEKFDPDGQFIKKFCPELSQLRGGIIHDPDKLSPLIRAQLNYPEPIVSHTSARAKALAIFKQYT
ncbi:MAG: Deoxyribodipyrimidine photo-lyase [Legionellaceae bacterium]